MLWIILALLAHFGNGLVFVVDKGLLSGKGSMSRPLNYAFYSAVLAGFAIILLPFAYVSLTPFIFMWALVAGLCHVVALWLFFIVLKGSEPSRIVPMVGSAVPLFTFVFAVLFLGESFFLYKGVAVLFLIVGGVFLSISFSGFGKISLRSVGVVVASGLFFALYFVVMKHLYDNTEPFLAVFVYSRVVEALIALVLLGPIVWFRREKRSSKDVKVKEVGVRSGIFVGNKVLAAGAFLLQSYAISLGSVSVVNALQGTQYLFVLLLAAGVSIWYPRIFKEEVKRVVLVQKIFGICFIAVGVWFLL